MLGSPRGEGMNKFCARLAALVLVSATGAAVLAQQEVATNYPSRAVKIIVSAPPGGGLDIVARVITDRLARRRHDTAPDGRTVRARHRDQAHPCALSRHRAGGE